MTYDNWKRRGYDLRHVVMRFAVNGFHYKLCKTKRFHQPESDCVFERCEKSCERYHAKHCADRHKSLMSFCSSDYPILWTIRCTFFFEKLPPVLKMAIYLMLQETYLYLATLDSSGSSSAQMRWIWVVGIHKLANTVSLSPCPAITNPEQCRAHWAYLASLQSMA